MVKPDRSLIYAQRSPRAILEDMVPTLLTGLFALSGVSLGVLLDPLRSSFARRSQARQERADRCAKLVEAATTVRSLSLEINFIHRQAGSAADQQGDWEPVFSQYRASRRELKTQVALLQLSGPDDLARAALALREADRELRSTRTVRRSEGADVERDNLPDAVRNAAAALEAEILRFAQLARKSI